jgi:hypothetical protein
MHAVHVMLVKLHSLGRIGRVAADLQTHSGSLCKQSISHSAWLPRDHGSLGKMIALIWVVGLNRRARMK